jgi:glycosyltransferase involved in cell wall biosynthesis
MAAAGAQVHLISGGKINLEDELDKINAIQSDRLTTANFSRLLKIGNLKIKSNRWFARQLTQWFKRDPDNQNYRGFAIHLKAAAWFQKMNIPYLWEAHEVFSETASKRRKEEAAAIKKAARRIATSQALVDALRINYGEDIEWKVVPNAGLQPFPKSIANPQGPILYVGSLEGWKGLHIALSAALSLNKSIRIVGGDEAQKNALLRELPFPEKHGSIEWWPRQKAKDLFQYFDGASVGVIPTLTENPSGRTSCPMKLFDYARAGLPVISSPLLSLQSLQCGDWLKVVEKNTIEAWKDAFLLPPRHGEEALKWAAEHTWEARGKIILEILSNENTAR